VKTHRLAFVIVMYIDAEDIHEETKGAITDASE
jgi:hypothetical protein